MRILTNFFATKAQKHELFSASVFFSVPSSCLGRHRFEALLQEIYYWEAELPFILSQAGAWDRDKTF
jgi:hypothetical protein